MKLVNTFHGISNQDYAGSKLGPSGYSVNMHKKGILSA